ncbi:MULTISPECIES: DUF2500 domain-containing protein [Vibrio]|uniref:DUF2500 family protein n=1 Tax=Vibrio casei TaxID=673372 RepID=A0A368LJS9_9VIBR|nr:MULTISPECIES: DUF2500 domain-containing protein [Vibrio]RCS72154.1 DUF2500 family protein [Vibrio casei]HBV76541.1 DUF2500 domain-containing protein [Vibrio sp.]
MPITLLICILLLIALAAWMYISFHKKHNLGEDAPEKKVNVIVLEKQSINIPNAAIGDDDQEYWIYVQKLPLGPKREFKVGIHYFSALNTGDKGVLTYKGHRFMHFALKRD